MHGSVTKLICLRGHHCGEGTKVQAPKLQTCMTAPSQRAVPSRMKQLTCLLHPRPPRPRTTTLCPHPSFLGRNCQEGLVRSQLTPAVTLNKVFVRPDSDAIVPMVNHCGQCWKRPTKTMRCCSSQICSTWETEAQSGPRPAKDHTDLHGSCPHITHVHRGHPGKPVLSLTGFSDQCALSNGCVSSLPQACHPASPSGIHETSVGITPPTGKLCASGQAPCLWGPPSSSHWTTQLLGLNPTPIHRADR